jgi:NhaP-type Na+/H+ or K+/H+ antiporter
MITRLTAAIVALLAFAGMILAGLAAGNPFETILYRALIGLVVGLAVGHIAGVLARKIVHEHFTTLIERDTETELTAAGVPAVEAAPVEMAAAQPAAATVPAGTVTQKEVAPDVAQEPASDGRQKERLTRERTLSMRAAREMQNQL